MFTSDSGLPLIITNLDKLRVKKMNKLNKIKDMCKSSVSVGINCHKDVYESVAQHINGDIDEIDTGVLSKMIELDTVIEIRFYPDTPIGFYTVYHYDLDIALDKCLSILNN